jgi:hypothetical protein
MFHRKIRVCLQNNDLSFHFKLHENIFFILKYVIVAVIKRNRLIEIFIEKDNKIFVFEMFV